MYHLPLLPLACFSPPNLAFSITYFYNNLSPMPFTLINLFLSSFSNLINVFPKHSVKMADYLAWGENFAHTLVSLFLLSPLFSANPSLSKSQGDP